MKYISLFLIGLLFGLGIIVSGMVNPAKVINFFDVAGTWDASLAFVMGSAVVVVYFGYRLVMRRKAPLFDTAFHLPTKRDIDLRLVGGAATFGVGWGIAGFCPGAALPALGTGMVDVMLFVSAMTVGLVLARIIDKSRSRSAKILRA